MPTKKGRKPAKLSDFRSTHYRYCNGLLVLHLKHESGMGRSKRHFASLMEAVAFVRTHRIRGVL